MNKHLHTFESHSRLDMPVNPAFYMYNKYEDFMDDPTVADLVNTLNDLWWENEAEAPSDERANEVGARIEQTEKELQFAIANYDMIKHQHEQEQLDEDQQQDINDVVECFEKCLADIKNFEYEIENIKGDCYYSTCEVTLDLIVDEEDYNISIGDGIAYLNEFDYNAELGSINEYYHERKTSQYDIAQSIEEMLKTEGESFIDFLKIRDDSTIR